MKGKSFKIQKIWEGRILQNLGQNYKCTAPGLALVKNFGK
jgi:hypothetical protein